MEGFAVSHERNLECLVRAVQELSLARDLDRIAEIVRSAARELVNADGATFVLRDDDRCFYKDEDAISPLWKGLRFPIESCISGWAMINCEPVVVEDIYRDPRIPHDAYRPTFVKSLVMVPIRRLSPVGAIGTYWAHQRRAGEREVALLQALADSTSVAMENVQLYRELEQRVEDRTRDLVTANRLLYDEACERERVEQGALRLEMTDELSGLNNRIGFLRQAESALQDARRRGDSRLLLLHLVLEGLDGLDGEARVMAVARFLRERFGQGECLARLGGGVFLVLTRGEPESLKRRLRAALDSANAGARRPLALRIGHLGCGVDDDPQRLMRQAEDAALAGD